jgi:hypothetical protein
MGRVKDGLVLCDHCDTPASRSLSLVLSWTACAPCVFGWAKSFDHVDLIHVGTKEGKSVEKERVH